MGCLMIIKRFFWDKYYGFSNKNQFKMDLCFNIFANCLKKLGKITK